MNVKLENIRYIPLTDGIIPLYVYRVDELLSDNKGITVNLEDQDIPAYPNSEISTLSARNSLNYGTVESVTNADSTVKLYQAGTPAIYYSVDVTDSTNIVHTFIFDLSYEQFYHSDFTSFKVAGTPAMIAFAIVVLVDPGNHYTILYNADRTQRSCLSIKSIASQSSGIGTLMSIPTSSSMGTSPIAQWTKTTNSILTTQIYKFRGIINPQADDDATIPLLISKSKSSTQDPNYNPYEETDASTGGGDGNGSPADNDTQDDDGVPTLSITDTGLISLYSPSLTQLQQFGNYLWSDLFSLDSFKKLFADPIDSILGMSVVPLSVTGTDSNLIIGNVDTGISALKLSQQYYTIDCGSFTVEPDIDSYLDYSPYTRFSVFLPYIGFQTLDADDIMGQTLNIKYKVDVLTTALICEIRIDNHLRYSFSGTCGTSIPITAQNWGSMIQSVISSATALVGLAVGAAAAPVTGGASLGMSAVGAAGSIAGNSLSMKPDIQKGGNLGGSPGFMGWQSPFLIRYTPRRVNSKSQQTYTGYPSLITSKLSDVHGYTEIQSINLSVSGATDSECSEIDRQLKQGVILP